MEFEIVISNDAAQDMIDIYNYLEKAYSEQLAQKKYDQIADAICSLSYMPERFRKVMFKLPSCEILRQMVVGSYSIIYTVVNNKVYIINVFHNASDIENRLIGI